MSVLKKILFIYAILVTYIPEAYCLQKAKVKSIYAYIYPTYERKNPIAKIRKNTIIYTGDIARNKRTMIPTVIYNKIVYIPISDLIILERIDE
jgi:hypothetical protein